MTYEQASSTSEMYEIPVVEDGSIVYSNGNRYYIVYGTGSYNLYSNSASFSQESDGNIKFSNKTGIVTLLNNYGSISYIYYDPQLSSGEFS